MSHPAHKPPLRFVLRLRLQKGRGGGDVLADAGQIIIPFSISKEASSKDYVCLCSVDLAYVSNSQSSCL